MKRFVSVTPALIALVVFVVATLGPHNPTSAAFGVVFLLTVPGDLLRRALGVQVESAPRRLVYAVALGLTLQMLLTLAIQLVAAPLGVAEPLSRVPAMVGQVSLICVLALLASRTRAAPAGPFPWPPWWWVPLFALAPALMYVGIGRVDAGHGDEIAYAALALGALLAVLAVAWPGTRLLPVIPVALYSLGLTVLWAMALRSHTVFGWDIHAELGVLNRTLAGALWQPRPGDAYQAMLSITSLPTMMSSLTGIDPTTYLKVVAPGVFALYPVVAYLLISRMGNERLAAALSMWLVMVPVGFWQVGSVVRQQVALVISLVLVLVLVDWRRPDPRPGEAKVPTGDRRSRIAMAALLGVGCVLAHYSTAYILIVILLAAGVGQHLTHVVLRHRIGPWLGGRPMLPVWLSVFMLLISVGWNNVYTQSTDNVANVAARFADSGAALRSDESFLAAWLNGTEKKTVPASELFTESSVVAEQRPWMEAYSPADQQRFPVVDVDRVVPPGTPDPPARGGAVLMAGYVLGHQVVNIVLFVATIALPVVLWRRRHRASKDPQISPERGAAAATLAWLALGALAVTGAVRLSTSLALDYNAERLALQTFPFMAAALVTVVGAATSALTAKRARLATGLVRAGCVVLSVAAVFEITGLKADAFPGYTESLIKRGENYHRNYFYEQDIAAAKWLGGRWFPDNMVFTDNYGHLLLAENPSFDRGVFHLLTPQLLDQRAYVLATTENYRNHRARGSYKDLYATYFFPRDFLDFYKRTIYNNGKAAIYE